MKKLYQQPTIEQEFLLVEAGIAISGEGFIVVEDESSAGLLDENIW